MKTPRIRALAIAATLIPLAACAGNGSGNSLPANPTPSQIAQANHLTQFADCGPAPLGGVTDTGVAYDQTGKRFGIDTFPTKTQRDQWLTTAEQVGVAPRSEGDTWVLYSATDQATKGCG